MKCEMPVYRARERDWINVDRALCLTIQRYSHSSGYYNGSILSIFLSLLGLE
jgi:hypothetical protein